MADDCQKAESNKHTFDKCPRKVQFVGFGVTYPSLYSQCLVCLIRFTVESWQRYMGRLCGRENTLSALEHHF